MSGDCSEAGTTGNRQGFQPLHREDIELPVPQGRQKTWPWRKHIHRSPGEQASALEGREWRRFWNITFFATILPLLALLAALEGVASYVGETYTPGQLLSELHVHPDLVWMSLHVQTHAGLKLAQVASLRPEVLIMGNSRVAKLRENMFRPYSFYNLARVSWPFATYSELLRRMPAGYRPKVIIFSVDFFMFSPKFDEEYRPKAPIYGFDIVENLSEVKNVATQMLQRPLTLLRRTDFAGRPARGLSSMLVGDAFIRDGSERTPQLYLFAHNSPAFFMQRDSWSYVSPGAKMGEAQMAALKEFVDLGRKMGSTMVAVQMPIYGPVLRAIERDPDYGILEDFRNRVAQGYFHQLGIPFFDYSNFPPYTEDYRYFFDPVHPGLPLNAAVALALGSDPQIRALLPNMPLEDLRRQLLADKTASEHLTLNQ